MSGRHIARRGLIAGSALLLVAGAAGSAKAEEQDGELLALCREFEEREAQFKVWDDETEDLPPSHPRVKEVRKLERALVERGWEIREEVAELKAHTPEGLQAKAKMVLIDLEDEADPTKPCCNHQYLAAVSLARDILGRA